MGARRSPTWQEQHFHATAPNDASRSPKAPSGSFEPVKAENYSRSGLLSPRVRTATVITDVLMPADPPHGVDGPSVVNSTLRVLHEEPLSTLRA